MLDKLRKLAQSVKYQNLYARAKELNHIRIFENETDFSYIQSLFIYYLELYESLNKLLSPQEEYLTQEVIDDSIRLESYLLWKNKNKNKKEDKKTAVHGPDSVIFKRT